MTPPILYGPERPGRAKFHVSQDFSTQAVSGGEWGYGQLGIGLAAISADGQIFALSCRGRNL